MNALWLERLAKYRTTKEAQASISALLELKDNRRVSLLKKFKTSAQNASYTPTHTTEQLLLIEARNAKIFWHVYGTLLPKWCYNFSRIPRAKDVVNRLLDIGYHHLATAVEKNIIAHNIPPDLGLIHRAHRSDSVPLVYDVMEMFRADCVDSVLLTFLRQKKKSLEEIDQRTIGMFLSDVNTQMNKHYYLAVFQRCHVYRYYMDLQITKFIKAINHGTVFEPLHLPTRHENRCVKTVIDKVNRA